VPVHGSVSGNGTGLNRRQALSRSVGYSRGEALESS
jgi:hypothetical protein